MWEQVFQHLAAEADNKYAMIDATIIRVHQHGAEAERDHAREIIDKTERALRHAITEIADPQAKRAAIQARQRLYKAGVQEYREERREAERQRRRAVERDEGVER